MKIDKTNPGHWLCLALFGANVLCAMLLRSLRRQDQGKRLVVLYGHKLNGNLLAIHRYWQAHARDEFDMVFLTMDKAYHRQLLADGIASVLATRPAAMRLLARANAVISDHGLHAMAPMVGRGDIKFFDVWHGIPFKGFDADDFRLQHRYDEVWVASPLMKTMYVERYGFDADKVEVTGYARTDRLVRQDEDIASIKRNLGLDSPDVGKIVLFAPTWKHDARQRDIFPFGLDEQAFLDGLSELAQRSNATFVMRTHLNSGVTVAASYPHIVQRPFADYPDTEALLLVSDMLVCDWSSIAFDWLLLDRPTVFLDVPTPFAKGLSLGKDYRYGEVVVELSALTHAVAWMLADAQSYWQRHGNQQQTVKQRVYGSYADGEATVRSVAQLCEILPTEERR